MFDDDDEGTEDEDGEVIFFRLTAPFNDDDDAAASAMSTLSFLVTWLKSDGLSTWSSRSNPRFICGKDFVVSSSDTPS